MFKKYIEKEIQKHPDLEAVDVLKLLLQGAYGISHALGPEAYSYLVEEWNQIKSRECEALDFISPYFLRLNLEYFKKISFNVEWVWHLMNYPFFLKVENPDKEFVFALDEAIGLPVMEKEKTELIKISSFFLKTKEFPHHSEKYRKLYSPHYRVLPRSSYPVLMTLEKIVKQKPRIIAIDGKAGAGKTTLSLALSKILNAQIIKMDDFFLPKNMRSKERLSEVGGNIDYERFINQVILNLNKPSFSYGVFDCSKGKICGEKIVKTNEVLIVEGSYSHHPRFGSYADLKIFFDIEKEKQLKRIKERDKDKYEIFENLWIPLENEYFSAFCIKENADLCLKELEKF